MQNFRVLHIGVTPSSPSTDEAITEYPFNPLKPHEKKKVFCVNNIQNTRKHKMLLLERTSVSVVLCNCIVKNMAGIAQSV